MMSTINLKNVSVWYGDGNGNTIAVCCKEHNRDSVKYKLYSTNNDLNNFELISTADSPTKFDSVLYSNNIKILSQKRLILEGSTYKDEPKYTEISTLSISNNKSKSNKRNQTTSKHKPLF